VETGTACSASARTPMSLEGEGHSARLARRRSRPRRDRVEGQSLLLRTARFPMTSHRDRRVTKPGRASDIFQRQESRSVITLEESVWGEERGRTYFGLLGASVRLTDSFLVVGQPNNAHAPTTWYKASGMAVVTGRTVAGSSQRPIVHPCSSQTGECGPTQPQERSRRPDDGILTCPPVKARPAASRALPRGLRDASRPRRVRHGHSRQRVRDGDNGQRSRSKVHLTEMSCYSPRGHERDAGCSPRVVRAGDPHGVQTVPA
jgi:hypothetical protein